MNDGPVNDYPRTANGDATCVHDASNMLFFDRTAMVRTGTERRGVLVPTLVTGISATKSGSTITVTAGHTPSTTYIGAYFVYDDGENELITASNGSTTYTVSETTAHAASTAGKIRAEVWSRPLFHTVHKLGILHIGTKLYYLDQAMTTWTEIINVSPDCALSAVKSRLVQADNYAYLFNGTGGIFKIEIGATTPVFYKVNNTMIVGPTLASNDRTEERKYGRRYIVTLSRQNGSTLDNRLATGKVIAAESAPNFPNDKNIDFCENWSKYPPGEGLRTYTKLVGGALAAERDTVAEWEVITNGQFKFTVSGVTYNIEVDFSGCITFTDIADRLQVALRDYWIEAVAEYNVNHFEFYVPVASAMASYCTAGAGGTDISGATYLNMLTGGTATLVTEYLDYPRSLSNILPSTFGDSYAEHNGALFGYASKSDGTYHLYKSTNGEYWEELFNAAGSPLPAADGKYGGLISYGGYLYKTSGDHTSGTFRITRSADGTSWSSDIGGVGTVPPDGLCKYGLVNFSSKMTIVGGYNGSAAVQTVYTSTDGITWSAVGTGTGKFTVRMGHATIVYGGYIWAIGGVNTAGVAYTDVWRSSDADTWTQVTANGGWTGGSGLYACEWQGKMLLGGAGAYFYTSSDGVTWTAVAASTTWSVTPAVFTYATMLVPSFSDKLHLLGAYHAVYSAQGECKTFRSLDAISWERCGAGLYRDFSFQSYTHYSVWATLDNADPANDKDSYAWLDDVPVLKVFSGCAIDTDGYITCTSGKFKRTDIGSVIVFSPNSLYGRITAFVHETKIKTEITGSALSGGHCYIGCATGSVRHGTYTQSGTTVTLSNANLVAGDVGRQMWLADGTRLTFKAILTTGTATVDVSATVGSAMAYAIPPYGFGGNIDGKSPSRSFCDTISDEVLATRFVPHLMLPNRYWDAMPNCDIGAVTNTMMFGAVRNSKQFVHCQLTGTTGPGETPWIAGYYHPYHQVLTLQDSIRDMVLHKGSVSALCTNRADGWDTVNVATITVGGANVIVLSQKWAIDENIGVMDWTSIQPLDRPGLYLVRTSNNEFRVLDGQEFQAGDLIEDHISTKVRALQPLGASSFDMVAGYRYWGTTAALTSSRNPFPEKCYLIGIKGEHGAPGGVPIEGTYWPKPADGIGGFSWTDANGHKLSMIFNNRTGYFEWISTFDGPTGSGLTTVFTDRTVSGTGQEIAAWVHYKAHYGTKAHYRIKSKESHFHMRPYNEASRSTTGHDSAGFRSSTVITVEWFKDGEPTAEFDSTTNVPMNGEVSAQLHPEAFMLQQKLSISKSEVVLTGSTHYYSASDKALQPELRKMDEETAQLAWAAMSHWFTRPNVLVDRVLGNQTVVTSALFSTTGPDVKTDSASYNAVAWTFPTISVGEVVTFWEVTAWAATVTIGGAAVSPTTHQAGTTWRLRYFTAGVAGVLVFTPTAASMSVFDVRIFPAGQTATTYLAYYYDQVTTKGGDVILPPIG